MRRRSLAVMAITAAGCLASSAARAASADGGGASGGGAWYGWQVLLVDAASTGLIVGGAFAAQDGGPAIAIPAVGVAAYLAGGPLVHLAHVERGRAGRSALLRFLLPVGVGAVGAGLGYLAAGGGSTDVCSSGRACGAAFGGAVGAGAGMLAAMIVDAATASPTPPARTAGSAPAGGAWTPLFVVRPGTTSVGVAVRF